MKPLVLTALALGVGASAVFAQTNNAPATTTNTPPPNATVAPATNAPVATAPATNAPAANKAIRLQFEGIPYMDVIERFSQMAGKPLVTDTNIAGTLTFNDPNPYNYQEALDTLNIALSMKGVMLMESGNHLRLVGLKNLASMPLKIMRGTDASGDTRPSEVVTVVLDVQNVDSKEVADAVTAMLSNAGSVAPLSKGRGLIVTDRMENIQRIRTLLTTIDVQATVDRQMKTYNLLHGSGAIITDLLNRTFGVATAPKRTTYNPNSKAMEVLPADPNDYITAVYDDASRTIVLFGPRERIGLAEELIQKFEGQGAGGDVRIYYPQTIKPEELANMIRQAVPGVAAANEAATGAGATKARLIADATQNRLIVAAPIPGQLDEIERLISRIDKGAVGAGGANNNVPMRSQTVQLTKVFRPRSAEATNLVTILNQALTRRNPNGSVATSASISHDPASQSVVVSGSPGDLQIATDIVNQLETGSSQPTTLQTRFIDVGTAAEARRLQPLVEQLYRNQAGSGSQVAHAKIMADAEAGRLIVTATEEHIQRIEELTRQLRTGREQPTARTLKIVKLENVRVETALANIQSVVTDKMSERPFSDLAKPSLIADAANNRLLITATDAQIAEIEQVVRVMDVAPEKETMEMRAIKLNAKTAAEVIPMVTQLLDQTKDSTSTAANAPKLIADPSGRQIIALARAKDLERVEALVMQFDTSPATTAPRQFKAVELVSRGSAELTPLVQQLYQEQLRGQPEPAGGAATIIAEAKNNRVMISGSEKEIARVEAIVRQLDPEEKRAAKEETRVIRLKTASAAELQGLVEKSLNGTQQQVRVLLDARSNSLIVSGEPSAVAAASEIVNQLDTRPNTGPRELRVIELKSAEAATMSPMLNTMFSELLKDQRGVDYVSQTKIVPDATANRIIVTGVKEEIEQVAGLVQQLDQAPEQAPGARVFKLVQADAVMLAPIVSQAMMRYDSRGLPIRRVTVSADEKANALIVSGTRSDLADVASVIEKLDGESGGKEKTLKIFDVKSEDPDALAALVTKVFAAQNPGRNTPAMVNITAEPASKRLIVLAPISVMQQVEQVIQSLDDKPEQGARELHTVELKNATAAELMPKVTQIYGEQSAGKTIKPATIYPDASGTRFTVYGTKEQAASIRQIVETLESQARAPRETKVFETGRLAEAQRIIPIAQQLYRDQVTNNPQLGAADAQFITDGKTGRIIVTARADQMERIEKIISSLRVEQASESSSARETRIFELTTASAVELAVTVRTLYLEEAKARFGATTPDTMITPDAGANRLIVVGETNELTAVEDIVKKLDKVSAQSATARVFKIKSAEPDKVQEILQAALVRYDAYGRPQKRATVSVDGKSRTLIVTGDPRELQSVATIIEQLDTSLGQQVERKMKVVAVNGKVAETSSKLRQLFQDQVRNRPELGIGDPLILEDSASNQLILAGSAEQIALMDTIIGELQKSHATASPRESKMIEIGQSDEVTRLMPQVQQLYQERWRDRAGDPADAMIMPDLKNARFIVTGRTNHIAEIEAIVETLRAGRTAPESRDTRIFEIGDANELTRVQPLVQQLYLDKWKGKETVDPADATIIADAKNARLLVTGRPAHLAEIEAILQKVSSPTANAEPRDTRVYDLESTTATELASTVRSLYQEGLRGRPVSVQGQATVFADATGNRLIVSGATNELHMVEEIVKKLDQVVLKSAGTKLFKLKNAVAQQVATTLSTALVDIRPGGLRVPRVTVGTDPENNVLIVAGNPKDIQAAGVIIEQFDSVEPNEARTMRILALKSGVATDVATRARQIYLEQVRGQNIGMPNALIMGDDATSRLIVTASEAHLKVVEEIVSKLQEAGDGAGRQLRTLPLQRNAARSVSQMIMQLFAKEVASKDPADRLIVTAAPDDRTLVVEGSAKTLDSVQELVGKLDSATENQNVIQTVHLKKGTAIALAESLTRAMAGRAGDVQRVTVTPVFGANSLLINGPTNGVEEVIKIVRELDSESTGGEIEVRIFKLENGNVREIQGVLNNLLETVSRTLVRGGGTERRSQYTISVNQRDNSLIVSGTEAHFKVIEKILPTLDKAPERSDRDVQFVWLKKAKAADVAAKLDLVFADVPRADEPVIEADTFANSLTIIARRGDMAQIQDLISRLDETARDSSMQVRLRPLDNVAAEQMARMLQNLYPQMSRGKLRVVEKVTPPADGGTNQPPAAPAPAPDAAAAPTATETPEVVVAVDKDANALVLSGPAQELDNIDRIINELTFSFYGNEAEFRLFPLKEADPVLVSRTLSDLLKQEPVQVQQPGQAPRLVQQPPRITIVPDARTKSIIVRARPTDFNLIETIVKQLDVGGQNAQIGFRLIPLTNAPPAKVLPLVQQMVTQLNTVRPGEPLTVTMDARSHGILVVAREATLEQVEKMIRSLDAPSAYVEAGVQVISLKKSNAAQLAVVLQNMLKPGTQGEWTAEARELQEQVRRLKVQNDKGDEVLLDLTKPIKIAADPISGAGGGNRLIITSTADNLKALAAVVEMMDSVSLVEGVEVRIVPLKHADATSAAATLSQIFAQGKVLAAGPAGPAQPDSATGEALANPIAVVPDGRSNSLIISAQAETLDLAVKVIGDLDKAVDRFVTEVKLFRVKHASATRLVPLLQSVFAEGPPVPGTEGLNTQITRLRTLGQTNEVKTTEAPKTRASLVIQADDISNILIVAARSDALPLIEQVLQQLDIPAASGLEMVRIYPLDHADPTTIQRILNEMHTARAASIRAEDRPVISIDDRTNALIVAGSSKAFSIIEALLQQLDKELPFELRDIKIIPLETTDASAIASTIQRLMDARITQRAAANRGATDTLKVTIIPDQRSNSLLVAGGRDSFEMVESLAKALDKAGPALSGQIRLIPLEFADSRVIAATFTSLFTQRYAAARTTDVQRQAPIILADPRSNSLLVTANQEDNKAIDELLKKLDAKMQNPALTLTVIPMKHNDAGRVSVILEGLFAARLRAQTLPGQTPSPAEQIEIQTDVLNNALIVSASKENLAHIQELLQKIDVEPTVAEGMLQTFTLEFADAQRVASMLTSLVQQGIYRPSMGFGQGQGGGQGGGNRRNALAVTVDPRSNTLIVSASPENIALVREIIRRVDTKDFSDSLNARVYTLKNARASSLASTLQQFFAAKARGDAVAINAPERNAPVSVIPDDRINALIVTGTKEAFDAAERIISQLDAESAFARQNFRVFPLKQATATKLQPTLQQIVANRPPRARGEPIEPITIVADAWVNALLVAASVDDMNTVASLIEKLDSEPTDTGIAVHVFPLIKADARRVAQTVQALFRENTPGVALPVTVSADERMNAIVVSCGEADAKRIAELVKKLDTEQVARVSEIKVFPLKYARAELLSQILNNSLNAKPVALTETSPNAQSVLQFVTRTEDGQELVTAALKEAILITPDSRMNSLIVSGPVDYMGLLEQIIGRLDASSPQEAKIKVFQLQNADAQNMAILLNQLFRMQQTAGGVAGQRSVQYTLMRPTATGPEEAVATATLGTAEQSALTVTVDLRTNSLLVGGTEHYVSLVSQIIDSLDASAANERKTEVVRLKNSQAQEVALAIRTFLDQERQRITTVLGAEAIGTAQRMLEREVAVVAEPISNTLLVSANPRYYEEVKALIDELDRPQSQVMIQVLLAEVTLDGTSDLGVEWSYTGRSGSTTYGVGTDFNVRDQLLTSGGFSTAVSGGDFSFLLRALREEGRLEVLSRPQIVTADNKPATVNIGQRVPLITDSRVTERGDTINSFRYEDVGVNMTVTPKISPDGFVKIELTTTNSAISSSNVEINSSAVVPIINQRRASTTVSVQNGQTIIIGGLIATTDDRRVKKVPVLGNIPGLGALFRSTLSSRDRKELLILLTPQVLVNEPNHAPFRDVDDVTRENLDRSRIKDRERDDLQKQILEPLYPEMRDEPDAPLEPSAKARTVL